MKTIEKLNTWKKSELSNIDKMEKLELSKLEYQFNNRKLYIENTSNIRRRNL